MTAVQKTPTRPEKFRNWYLKNQEATSQKRRERYANDPKYRARIKKRAIQYRKNRMHGKAVERTLKRVWRGVPTQVYTTGHVVDVVGCTYYQLRGWEDRGWIPASVFPDRHRLYLKHQLQLIGALHKVVLSGASDPAKSKPLAKALTNIKANWGAV